MNYEEYEYSNSTRWNTCSYSRQVKQQMWGVNEICLVSFKACVAEMEEFRIQCCQWCLLRLGAILNSEISWGRGIFSVFWPGFSTVCEIWQYNEFSDYNKYGEMTNTVKASKLLQNRIMSVLCCTCSNAEIPCNSFSWLLNCVVIKTS